MAAISSVESLAAAVAALPLSDFGPSSFGDSSAFFASPAVVGAGCISLDVPAPEGGTTGLVGAGGRFEAGGLLVAVDWSSVVHPATATAPSIMTAQADL